MKTVLVCGGAGFIGSHLCDYLVNKNYNVYCVDNLKSGKLENIAHLLKFKNFHFLNIDINDINNFKKISFSKLDEIYHLASLASPKFYNKYPIETSLSNSAGTINLLNLAHKFKSKFLFASSSEVYGNPSIHPQPEELIGKINPLSLKASYAEAKRFGETITYLYNQQHGLDTKIVRIFNTYGPRMRFDDGRVIPSFIYNAFQNTNLKINGDGSQTRSFCYIDDLIEGLFKVMQVNYNFPINLGNPNEEISIYDLALKIKKLINPNVNITFLTDKVDEIRRRKPDVSKAKKLLDWEPKYNLQEGLDKTVKFFKENL